MNYQAPQQTKKSGLFSNLANPVLRKLQKNGEYESSNAATYAGITSKTLFFLLATLIGVAACLLLHKILITNAAAESLMHYVDTKNGIIDLTFAPAEAIIMVVVLLISLITPFLAWLIRPTIPVVGTLYSLAQGFLIGYITTALAPEYKFISLLAMLLTLALVGGMLFVYAKRIIQVTAKFRGVLMAIFFSLIATGIIYMILMLIPGIRNSAFFGNISAFMNTPIVSIGVSILFVIIASLFMLADFDTIEQCVTNQVDKKYEWMAAWGLSYMILYIYFKILRILLTIFGNRSNSK
uniref:Bax inhibitor-1/YccA family protein n=1 Tax=uncultured bacterium Contigcl_1539 TaxID=1393650 RepID=W0FLY7_9BACT|nr:hypothetical protein [uncultured bacterium Contigcl_1539]